MKFALLWVSFFFCMAFHSCASLHRWCPSIAYDSRRLERFSSRACRRMCASHLCCFLDFPQWHLQLTSTPTTHKLFFSSKNYAIKPSPSLPSRNLVIALYNFTHRSTTTTKRQTLRWSIHYVLVLHCLRRHHHRRRLACIVDVYVWHCSFFLLGRWGHSLLMALRYCPILLHHL